MKKLLAIITISAALLLSGCLEAAPSDAYTCTLTAQWRDGYLIVEGTTNIPELTLVGLTVTGNGNPLFVDQVPVPLGGAFSKEIAVVPQPVDAVWTATVTQHDAEVCSVSVAQPAQ